MHAWQVEDLTKELGPKEYQTSTRGARSVEAARALGEGHFQQISSFIPIPFNAHCDEQAA